MRTVLIALAVLVGVWVITIAALVAGRRLAARELATFVPNLLLLFRALLKDPAVSRRSKFWLGFALAWIASPIDLIPEFIPVAGPLDDVIVAGLVLRGLVRSSEPDVVARHWRGGEGSLDVLLRLAGKPRDDSQS